MSKDTDSARRPCGFNSWMTFHFTWSTKLCKSPSFSLEYGVTTTLLRECVWRYYGLNLNYSSKDPFVEVMVPSLWHCWVTEEPLRDGVEWEWIWSLGACPWMVLGLSTLPLSLTRSGHAVKARSASCSHPNTRPHQTQKKWSQWACAETSKSENHKPVFFFSCHLRCFVTVTETNLHSACATVNH